MVSQIQLGNIFSAGDRQILTGGNSGIDVEGLVTGLSEAKRQPAVLLESRIEANATRSTALTELKTLLTGLRDAANFLRNPPGVQNAADNIFEFRSALVSSNTAVSGDTYLSVTAEPGASIAEYSVTVTTLATQNIQTTNTFALADADTSAVGGAGPLNAGPLLVGAGAVSVTLVAGDTLNQVAAKVNAVKGQSGIEATVIKVSNGNFRLSFKSVETGTSQNYDILTANPASFNVGFALQQNAVNAEFELDSTTIIRESNSIDDVIDGLTFTLKAETPMGTALEVGVEADAELAKQGILNFIDSYNAFRLFASRQSEIGDSGTPTEAAVLASNSTLRTALSRATVEMSQIVDGLTAGDPARLSDLGITFSDFPGDDETPFTRNILTIDEEQLDSALAADFDAVRRVFEFDFTADDPDLQVFSRSNGLDVTSFSLNIDQTNGVFEATYTDPVLGAQTIALDMEALGGGSITLSGREGTVLEGLVLIYSDAGDSVVNVNLSQGIADRVFNSMDQLLEQDTGAVDVALSSVEAENARFEQEITRIDEIVERFRQRLLEQFSALEQAVSSANSLLASLEAQANANAN